MLLGLRALGLTVFAPRRARWLRLVLEQMLNEVIFVIEGRGVMAFRLWTFHTFLLYCCGMPKRQSNPALNFYLRQLPLHLRVLTFRRVVNVFHRDCLARIGGAEGGV